MLHGESSRNDYTDIYVTQPIMIPGRFGDTTKHEPT